MFIDKVTIKVQAGKGGDGLISFRRSRLNPMGGPDGGNGGAGGNIIFFASHNSSTLSKYRTSKLWKAQDGKNGAKNEKTGKSSDDLILVIPPGTVVLENGKLLADLNKNGMQEIVAKSGKGGFGNAHFKSSVRQAPKVAELGGEGEYKELTLELKMIADVGLVGLPNSGKSTLLSIISNAKPEIADYPFTTLKPNLGVVDFGDSSFLVADIPGLIEGASKGRGLGDEFLRHIERTKILAHLVDITSQNLNADYQTINSELKNYQVDLSKKPQITVLTKADLLQKGEVNKKADNFAKEFKLKKNDLLIISSIKKSGIKQLMGEIVDRLKVKVRKKAVKGEIPVISIKSSPEAWKVEKQNDYFVVSGEKIEGFAWRTDTNQPQAIIRLKDILKKLGILHEIVRQGGKIGSKIKIGKKFFEL
ncbi:MAG: GTPase ObgE [bacterium]|nr:GTPase ObgE [bacterium]